MRYGLHIAPFAELAEPTMIGDLAEAAETNGFDGVFIWDQIARPHKALPAAHVGVALAVIAQRTSRVRFGALVTPLTRRRPHDFAREAVSLDRLSGGRLIVGVGLGVNTGGELERFGEETDERIHGDRLDEALNVVLQCWTGTNVMHHGTHFRVDDVAFTPTPVQQPRVPIWVACRSQAVRPLRRAARFDGLVPETDPAGVEAMLATMASMRGSLDSFDVVCKGDKGDDPAPFERLGATWWLTALPEICTAAEAMRVAEAGPPK